MLIKVFGFEFDEGDPQSRRAVEPRARAYLDANCAHCHRPNAYADTALHGLDLRYEVSIEQSGLCEPMRCFPEWEGTPRIAPRAPADSGIIQRFVIEDAQRMPSIGTSTVDAFGTQLLSEWISQVRSCPWIASGAPPCYGRRDDALRASDD